MTSILFSLTAFVSILVLLTNLITLRRQAERTQKHLRQVLELNQLTENLSRHPFLRQSATRLLEQQMDEAIESALKSQYVVRDNAVEHHPVLGDEQIRFESTYREISHHQVEERPSYEQEVETDVVIYARDVHKTYYTGTIRVQALRGVSLKVGRGEMVAIMGPSGCGKTTLLNSLSGLDDFDSGTVLINGNDIARMADHEKTRFRAREMGFVFQTYNLLPVLSAAENVELPLIVAGTKPKVARELALDSLERVGLLDRANERPAQLSGGQRQRVTIARALVNRPAILWADEPTGALDSKTATEIMDLIVDLNRADRQSCVIVTHDRGVAERCHRIIHMADGLIVEERRNPVPSRRTPNVDPTSTYLRR